VIIFEMPVVNDFRSSDIRAKGQGAPLVPIFHKAITEPLPKPIAIVNIGGVANITWVSAMGELLAFDTGPGNAMINDIMKRHFGKEYDESGEIASRGTVDEEVLAEYLYDAYFMVHPPKSLDRNHFNLDLVKDLKPEDAVATLTALTAISIMMSNTFFNEPVPKFYIAGGGRLNKRIMETLGDRAEPIEAIGHNGDAFEAQAFAYLAVRVLRNLPISFPSTTGCKYSPISEIARIHSV
jgi:anhydro-N-acetylmuramic acid kinase